MADGISHSGGGSSNTLAIIPVSKKLGPPPFISHEDAIWKGSHNTMDHDGY